MMGLGRKDVVQMLKMNTPGNPMMASCGGFDVLKNPETQQIDPTRVNTPEVRASCCTSALTMSSARAQAAIYRNFAEGGGKLLSADAVTHALANEVGAFDGVMRHNSTFTQGGLARFADSVKDDYPEMAATFEGLMGWAGYGGSISVMDPKKKVTYMYCMSGMDVGLVGDPRTK